MEKEIVMTYAGLRALEDELEQLKTVKRKEVAEKIKVARGYGDLSENSEYDEAKNEQGLVEGRIALLEKMLKHARTCSSSTTLSRVRPPVPALMPMWVGRFVLSCLDVIAAAITVGLWRLPTSFCTISTGRMPPCSDPTTGLRSA